jgi:antitoxin component YwqK of YwqJK toxin-antitoxin module
MFRILLICVSLVVASVAQACLCDIRPLKEYIEYFPFIAHVRVTQKVGDKEELSKVHGQVRFHYKQAPVLVIEIVELFKGNDSVKSITEYAVNSSCEIGVEEGEEWIIFGEYHETTKNYYISACSPSTRYRNQEGERRWDKWGEERLIALRKYFNHTPPESRYGNGFQQQLYPNGKNEWIASYTGGLLDGNRKIYYADGLLHFDENFSKGKPDGMQKEFDRQGNLRKESVYESGKCLQYKEWGHPANRNKYRGLYEEFYYWDSTYSILKKYDEKGRLEEEREEDEVADMHTERGYYPSGKLKYRFVTWRSENKTIQLFWKEEGSFEMKRIYIENKLIED